MTKYKRFIAAVRHLQDYQKQNTRAAVESSINARHRAYRDSGIEAARGTAANLEAMTERNITLAAVRRALADLPKDQRTMLTLICVDRMSYTEAGKVLNIPIGAMASRMARARKALHEQIACQSSAGVAGMEIPPISVFAARGDHR
jgi:RNA polymerase sigma factor (sigma-70 family)